MSQEPSDTPRVDSMLQTVDIDDPDTPAMLWVAPDDARQLERDLAAARAAVEEMLVRDASLKRVNDRLAAECAALKRAAEALVRKLDSLHMQGEVSTTELLERTAALRAALSSAPDEGKERQ